MADYLTLERLAGPYPTWSRQVRRGRLVKISMALPISAWVAILWLVAVIGFAALADVLPLPSATAVNPVQRLQSIGSPGHLLGTDEVGRDMLARLIVGARVSLVVALVWVVVGVCVGVPAGMIAGYFRGKLDSGIMLVADAILSFPALILLMAIVTFADRNLLVIASALGLLAIPAYARIARSMTVAISARDFVLAARALGSRPSTILIHEVVPNLIPSVLAYALVGMGTVIVVEGSLSFLGFSVQIPIPSWGGLIASGKSHLADAPQLVIVSAAVMFATVLALNTLGDVVRSRLDVRDSRV